MPEQITLVGTDLTQELETVSYWILHTAKPAYL